jgi:hypothetical protein
VGGTYALNRKVDPYAPPSNSKELNEARRKAANEELNPEGKKGKRKNVLVDSSGRPVASSYGFAHTEDKEEESDVSDKNFKAKNDALSAIIDANAKKRSYKKGGSVSSASSRADGIAQRGKTRGRVL